MAPRDLRELAVEHLARLAPRRPEVEHGDLAGHRNEVDRLAAIGQIRLVEARPVRRLRMLTAMLVLVPGALEEMEVRAERDPGEARDVELSALHARVHRQPQRRR